MKITAQDGAVYYVYGVEMRNNTIYGEMKTEKVELGRYPNLRRTCEVLSELTYIGWNDENGTYEMPIS